MPLHSLPEGRQMIAGLANLGRALGYSVEEERTIGGSGAAVDVAWYAADDNAVPLFIFEVESNATASMANNAMKVLSRDGDDFIKPLFFFHVLLAGGPDNDRISGLRRQWGSHNYRVYRLNEDAELLRLIQDVFSQHRRISKTVDVASIAQAMLVAPWSRLDRPSAMRALEVLKFEANYLGAYAAAALDNSDLRPEYLRRLRETHYGSGRLDVELHGTFLGDSFPNLLDVALLVSAGLIPEADATTRFEEWQNRSGYMRTIGPYFGLSRDYDQFVIGTAPFIYAIAGLLLSGTDRAYLWLVDDLYQILKEARERWNFGGVRAIPMALWLAHLASSGVGKLTATVNDDALANLVRAYELAVDVISDFGGVPDSMIDSPPPYIDIWEDSESWEEKLNYPRVKLPDLYSLNERYNGKTPGGLWCDAIQLALALVCKEDWPRWRTDGLVVALRAPRGSATTEADRRRHRPIQPTPTQT